MNKLVAVARTDNEKERGGVWVEYSPDGENVFRVKIARAGTNNPKFMKAQSDAMKPFRKSGRDAHDIEPTKQREITIHLYANQIVLDWHVEDFGEAFSVEACTRVFQQANDFLDFVVTESQKSDIFRGEQTKEDAKN